MKDKGKRKLKYIGVVVVLAFIACTYLASATTVITDIQMIIGNVSIGPDEIQAGNTTIDGESIKTDSINATAYYGNGSGLTGIEIKHLIQDFVVASGESVTAGDIVSFVNGYVKKGKKGVAQYVFNSATTSGISVSALDATHFVVAYRDDEKSYYGTAVIGTVAGSSISYGADYVFNSAYTDDISVSALDTTHFAVAYSDDGNSDYGTAVIGTVAGSSISYGSEYVFNFATTFFIISVSAMDATHFVVAYHDGGKSYYGTAVIGTVSGSSISYGSEYVFNSASTYYTSVSAMDATHFAVAYRDGGNSNYGTAVIGTVAGSSISYGAEYVFNSASTYDISVSAMDATHFVVAYLDAGNSNYGTAVIGTVAGSSISYGSEYVFNSASTHYSSVSARDATHFAVAYCDAGNSNYGTAVIGTVAGSSISYGSEYVFNSATTYLISVSALDATHFVVAYRDAGNSDYGTAVTGSLIKEDYVGVAKESCSEGQTCPVIVSGVADVFSGLTPGITYYTNETGGITTSLTDYRVGLAISENEILLNGNRDNSDQFFGDMVFANNFRITEASSYEGLIMKNQLGQEIVTVNEEGNLAITGNIASRGFSVAIAQITGTYTIGDNDYILICDASSAGFTVSLPAAVGLAGRQYTIKKIDSTGNAVTVDASGTETIDGSFSYSLDAQWKYVTIVGDGANWLIVAN